MLRGCVLTVEKPGIESSIADQALAHTSLEAPIGRIEFGLGATALEDWFHTKFFCHK